VHTRIGNIRGSFVLIALACLAMWLVSQMIARGDYKTVALGGMAFGVVAVAMYVLNNWRSGFYLFLCWLLFEDLARKYLGNGTLLFFGKDVLLAVVCFSFCLERRWRPVRLLRPPFMFSLAAFAALALAQVFNPNSPSIFYGLLGMKLDFFYVVLMFLGYALVESERDLEWFLVSNMVCAGLIALLGIVQSIVGSGFLNPATLAPDIKALATLTRMSPTNNFEVLRPCSVFVSTGRLSTYLIQMFILGFGGTVYLFLRDRKAWRVVLASLAAVTVAAIMTGARSCAALVAISAIVLVLAVTWGAPWRTAESHAVFRVLRRATLALGLGLFLSAYLFPEHLKAYASIYTETLNPFKAGSEGVYRSWGYPLEALQRALSSPHWLVGYGTGTASLGWQYVTGRLGVSLPDFAVEGGFGSLVVEMGILAPFLWLWWTASAFGSCLKSVGKLKWSPMFPVAFALFWFPFVLLGPLTWLGIVQYQNFVSNAYVWLFMGILFRIPALAAESRTIVGFQRFFNPIRRPVAPAAPRSVFANAR